MKFSRIFSVLAVLLFSALAFSCRDTPSSFLKEYEAFVVSVEKAAEKGSTEKLDNFSDKAKKFAERAKVVVESEDWTKENAAAYARLSGRFAVSMTKLSALKAKEGLGDALERLGKKLKN